MKADLLWQVSLGNTRESKSVIARMLVLLGAKKVTQRADGSALVRVADGSEVVVTVAADVLTAYRYG
jgi:hypothetical protein